MAYRESVEARINALLPSVSHQPGRLHEAMRYACQAPGKRIRPAFCLASCFAVSGQFETALNASCALEFVHCFSLIHDDLPAIDNDDLRRGLPTCHKAFDEATAVLAGDALFALAFEVLAANSDAGKAARCVLELAIASGTVGLVGGEALDVYSEGSLPNEALLETIHRRKTGALIGAACVIGAILGDGTKEQVAHLRNFGLSIGLAFQIADDILNETGDPVELGKSAGTDRERQKQTYPALIGVERSRERAGRLLEESLQHLDKLGGDTTWLRELATSSVVRKS